MSASNEYLAIDNVNIAFTGVSTPTFTEGGAAVDILPTATLTDPDNPAEFSGGSLRVQAHCGLGRWRPTRLYGRCDESVRAG